MELLRQEQRSKEGVLDLIFIFRTNIQMPSRSSSESAITTLHFQLYIRDSEVLRLVIRSGSPFVLVLGIAGSDMVARTLKAGPDPHRSINTAAIKHSKREALSGPVFLHRSGVKLALKICLRPTYHFELIRNSGCQKANHLDPALNPSLNVTLKYASLHLSKPHGCLPLVDIG